MADWDEHEHPRHPAKAPKGKGGEFRPKGTKAVRDLATLSRSTLLKYARERGLTIPRGHPDDGIRQMIRRFDSGVEPGWVEAVGERIAAKRGRDGAQEAIESLAQTAVDREKAAKLRRHAQVTRDLGHMRIANNPKGSYHHTRGLQDLKDADQMENEADRLDPPAHLREAAKKAPAKAVSDGRVNPKEIRVGDTIVIRRRNYDARGRLGPEQVEEHVVARIERTSARPSGWQFYDAQGKLVKGAASNSKIEVKRGERKAGKESPVGVVGIERPAKKTAVQRAEEKVEDLKRRLGIARENRNRLRGEAARTRSRTETSLEARLRAARIELEQAKREAGSGGWAEQVERRLTDKPLPFEEPPLPEPTRDPQKLYRQAVDYADAMNTMMLGDGPRFRELPALTLLGRLKRGVEPREVWTDMFREAEVYPEEWGGSREYLNRLATFIMRQATTMPKAAAEQQKERRARWEQAFTEAGGKEYWRTGTMNAGHAISDALGRLTAGADPAEVVQYLRASAGGLAARASRGEVQDYDMSGVLAYDPRTRQESAMYDVKLLRRLADAIAARS